MKWYRASKYFKKIRELDIIKETKCSLISEKGATRKQTSDSACFTNKEDAIEWKIIEYESKIELLKGHVKYAENELSEFIKSLG